jgi:hypothetical protein
MNRNSFRIRKRLGDNLKFLAIKADSARSRVTQILNARANLCKRRLKSAGFKNTHDAYNCTLRKGRAATLYLIDY